MTPLTDPGRQVRRPATGPPPAPPPAGDAIGPAGPALTPIGLCAAWSHHAAELAVPLGAALQHWEETPATDGLVADGYLARLLPGRYLPPDLLSSAVHRALALGCALGAQLQAHHVIAGPSAAWVVLGGAPPGTAELISPAHRGDLAGVVLRHSRLQPDEVETIGGAPVTNPVRTAMDLLRFSPTWISEPALRRLVEEGYADLGEIRRRLHLMHRHPGVHAARERLDQMLGAQRAVRGAPTPTGLPSAVTR